VAQLKGQPVPAVVTCKTATQELNKYVLGTARDHDSGYNKMPSSLVSVPCGLNDMQITELLDSETDLKYGGLKLQEV
jgi:hypothetical protein